MSCAATVELRLRECGMRVTPQRRQISIALAHAPHHATIEELQQRIEAEFGPPGIPTPTAYRTIEALKQHGLVTEVTSARGSSRFEWVDPAKPHHHLLCVSCETDEQVELGTTEPLEGALAATHDFEAFPQHFVLTGICRTCRDASGAASVYSQPSARD